ncbi:hypothetical protein MUU72_26540 [Streptomyces sp. RS10V-4]|uniref:hypothetical protein n=1 Tax=Streptomyces rhizoryzae TaxID=2932493 RepID=UPI00200659BF|nr:hypothetical protein [Streptomyces rhizoryzae]MCK7626617.1 hypothetical protein [Streptomyces rhizoryzae]
MSESRSSGPVAIALAALGAVLFAMALQMYLDGQQTYVDALGRFAGTAWGLSLTVAAVEWQSRRLSRG